MEKITLKKQSQKKKERVDSGWLWLVGGSALFYVVFGVILAALRVNQPFLIALVPGLGAFLFASIIFHNSQDPQHHYGRK